MKGLSVIFTMAIILLSGCNGCSRSGKRPSTHNKINNQLVNSEQSAVEISPIEGRTVVKMIKKNGVYNIPVEINGSLMSFIFDTGASIISISLLEAQFLYKQGTLEESDIIRKSEFVDATGAISEGTIIRLKSVKIGNQKLENVEASVVNNLEAPLLMGQSALARFGKISIDYNTEIITFE